MNKASHTFAGWGIRYFKVATLAVASLLLTTTVSIGAGNNTDIGWGNNYYGECNTPGSLRGVKMIAGWVNYTYALKTDGTLVGWGNNYQDVLNTPFNLTGVKQIDSGYHTYALKNDGTL